MSYTLLGSFISPFVRKVAITLEEKGIDYTHEDINPFAPPEGFREISPLGKIPAFRDGDHTINDSSVICRYIERKVPTPAFYPGDALASARVEWIEEYIDGGVIPTAGSKIFFPLVVQPLLSGEEPDETGPQQAIAEDMPPLYDYLESQLGTSEYFVGNSMTIADIAVGCAFVSIRLAGTKPDQARWPKLSAFINRMHTRPSFEKVTGPVKAAIGKRWI